MRHHIQVQDDWELDLSQGLRVSRLTTGIRWPRLSEKLAGLMESTCSGAPRVLDVGAGAGTFFDRVKPFCCQYVGLEPSRSALKQFTPQQGKSLCRGYAETLPFRDECFDAVMIKSTLDHCFDPQTALAESCRVLRREGNIFILLTNEAAWYKRVLGSYNALRKEGCRDHNFFFTPADLEPMLACAGFSRPVFFSYDYLRLPVMLENLAAAVATPPLISRMMDLLDRAGESFFPGSGGSFICTAVKSTDRGIEEGV